MSHAGRAARYNIDRTPFTRDLSGDAIVAEITAFADLVVRLRAGDPAAAAELFSGYEPAIGAAARSRGADTRLRRLFDSVDVCQTVLASFFARMVLGQYQLNSPEDLVKLLVGMARNKLITQVNRHRAGIRDYRRTEAVDGAPVQPAPRTPDPARQAAATDLLAEVYRRLSPAERRLVDLRQQGVEWAAIAETVGGTAQALRKQHARAVARVADEIDALGVET
jgi:RNA polymerase sigma factor (sigma-70 family)